MPNTPRPPASEFAAATQPSAGRHLSYVDPERLAEAMEHALEEMESRTLTEAELIAFRRLMRDQERMAWARDVFKSYWPMVAAVLGGLASIAFGVAKLVAWLAENVQLKGH